MAMGPRSAAPLLQHAAEAFKLALQTSESLVIVVLIHLLVTS